MALLQVENLTVTFLTSDGPVQAVRGVTFGLEAGRTLGVVGESGSGKSVTMQTVIGLTQGAHIAGKAIFEGRDLLAMSNGDLRHLRGAEISVIFQDPLSSLHPHYPVGWQVAEVIRAHERISASLVQKRVLELLTLVGIPQAKRRMDDYPFQFSGGMRQRVMIAIALALKPKLLIADEPTTALDVTVQAQILELLRKLQDELGLAIILISHDLGVIAEIADEAIVMYAGGVVERADLATLYTRPHHPYTRGLLQSLPASDTRARLKPIPGNPPSLIDVPAGCPFHPRCPFVMDRCLAETPRLQRTGRVGHESACWLPHQLVGLGAQVDSERFMASERSRTTRARELASIAAHAEASQDAVT